MAVVNVNTLYQTVQKVANKQQQGYISPSDFNIWMNNASVWLFDKYRGNPFEYQNRVPSPQMGYARTKEISQALAPFIVPDAALTLTAGLATKPDAVVDIIEMTSTYLTGRVDVRRVEYDRWMNWKNSVINTPTLEFPIYLERDTQYEFLPMALTGVKVTYLKKPTDGVWGYTIVSGIPVYNAGTSTNLEWDAVYLGELSMKILEYFGISVKDQQLFNNAVMEARSGQ